jgi:hypothetical protein
VGCLNIQRDGLKSNHNDLKSCKCKKLWEFWGFYNGSDENRRLIWYVRRLIEFNNVSEQTAALKIHNRPHRPILLFPQPDVTWFVIRAAYDNVMQENVVKCAKKNKWIKNESSRLVQTSTAFLLQIRSPEAQLQTYVQHCKDDY